MAENTARDLQHRQCSKCNVLKAAEEFNRDGSRPGGRSYVCRSCANAKQRATYVPKGPPARFGPLPSPGRDGDKVQARQRVNVEVRTGRRPHPNSLPCVDCGHIHKEGERRHEYDHYLGYAACHHLHVEPVCTKCHSKRDNSRAGRSHCIHGHEFTLENTSIAANGSRHCRTCAKASEKARPPRGSEYWARVNAKRRVANA